MIRDDSRQAIRRPAVRRGGSWAACAAVLSLLAQVCTVPWCWAEPVSTSDTPRVSQKLVTALETRGDLTLRNSSLEGALYTISELWSINVVTGAIEGQVNGVFKDAHLREILDSILISNGYSYRAVGDSLVVSRFEDLGQVNPFFESATLSVRVADVQEVVEGAKLLITPQGQVRALASARSIFVLDFPDRVELVRRFVDSIDRASQEAGHEVIPGGPSPLQVGYFRTQFVTAQDAAKALDVILSSEGRVQAIDKEDRLLVVDYAENLEMARRVLERVDRPRPQVRITALIYDISLQDVEELGINWNSNLIGRRDADGDPDSAIEVDSVLRVPLQANTAGAAISFLNLSRHLDLNSVILALQNATDARLLADPNIVVMENEDATFQSVSEIPFQQLTQTSAGGQIGTTSFKEAGITLKVTPKISEDGTIEMMVSPEFSRLTGFTPGDNQPIIDRRTAQTTLRVANKQLVVIGGLRQRGDVGDFRGVPYLKDINFFHLGKLFRARQTDVRESELVVFIMPEIVGYAYPMNYRQQLIADTIGCRLDSIPRAEGCPAPGGPGCADGCHVSGKPVIDHEDDVQSLAESPLDTAALAHHPGDVPDIQLQPSVSRVQPVIAQHVPAALRRLPPVADGRGDGIVPTAAVTAAPVVEQFPSTDLGLRAKFSTRYRDADDAQDSDPAMEQEKKKPSLFRRMFGG